MKLKVCGMRDSQNIRELTMLKPDYIGFIFYSASPRNVGEVLSRSVLQEIPNGIKKVGVFVNASLHEIKWQIKMYGFDVIQLHGEETSEFTADVKNLGIQVIKAFSIGGEDFDASQLEPYKKHVDYFLFDTRSKLKGGSGEAFDWTRLKKVYDNEMPFFLSGGISLKNIANLKTLKGMNLHAIDINSKFEISPGLKDLEMIQEFKDQIPSLKGNKKG